MHAPNKVVPVPAGDVTQTAFEVRRACLRRVMSGELPPGSCTSVTPVSDPGGLVAAASTALQDAVNEDCAATGFSPSTFGYRACPPPNGRCGPAKCTAPAN